MKKKAILPKEEVCIGCHLCEIYCAVEHSKTKDTIKTFKSEPNPPTPRVSVQEKGHLSFALQCRHCDEAPCVAACISGAMTKDKKTGLTQYEKEQCVGCFTCVMVCPFGTISPDEDGKKIAPKCDFCPEREVPACVENCPNRALVLVEVDDG